MYVFISILILICAALLVLIVLVQNSKGGGLASGFSSSNQVLGVRKTTDFLEKATWTLAIAVIVLCIGITAFIPREKVVSNSEVLENVSLPVNNSAPDFGVAQPDAQGGMQQEPAAQQETPAE
jgi:preprotein translocase subunit SecG